MAKTVGMCRWRAKKWVLQSLSLLIEPSQFLQIGLVMIVYNLIMIASIITTI